MNNPISKRPTWQKWAWKQLGAPAEASSAEAKLAAFATLAQADFAPPGGFRPALQLNQALDRSSEPPERAVAAFQKNREQGLRDAIEKFAQTYWSMAPAERQQMHQRLVSAAQEAPLARLRLEGLREGLAIEAITQADDDPTRELARKVQELYVLGPLDQAVRRHEVAASLGRIRGGKTALQLLPEDFPEIARLVRGINARIIEPPRKLKRQIHKPAPPIPSVRRSSGNSGGNWGDWFQGGGRGSLFVALMLISGLLRACATFSNHAPLRSVDKPFNPLGDNQLKKITQPDGKVKLQLFDKEGNPVDPTQAPKR